MTSATRTRPAPPSRWAWAGPAALGLGVAAATAYIAGHDPNQPGGYPECGLRSVLGWDCPACGGLRAVHALTNGDVAAAADHNLLAMVVLPVLVVVWTAWMLRSLGVRVPPAPRLSGRSWVAFGVSVGLLAVAFAVVRNVDGVAAFEYLHSDA